jgi:hypothetical protein
VIFLVVKFLVQTSIKQYNGKNLTLANCVKKNSPNGLIFDLTDEIGNTVSLPENTGFKLPTIWGNFVGPYSKNNDNPISLLDLFAAFHDQDYSEFGFFDTIGDFKLVSRISQNYDRMIQAEKSAAKTALLWFSTLGLSAGKLIGSLPKNIHRIPSNQQPGDDIYYLLDPVKATTTPIEQYSAERTLWYAELEKELESATITSSIFAQVSGAGNRLLAQEFGNILIEVL